MSVAMPEPTQDDWVKTVLFDRGYLARIRGDAIKVYLAIIEACGGVPDRSVTISLSLLMRRTQLSCPTVIESLARLEDLGLVVSTTHQRGKVKTYYVSDPPAGVQREPYREYHDSIRRTNCFKPAANYGLLNSTIEFGDDHDPH